jgi:hypothetical protein
MARNRFPLRLALLGCSMVVSPVGAGGFEGPVVVGPDAENVDYVATVDP